MPFPHVGFVLLMVANSINYAMSNVISLVSQATLWSAMHALLSMG